MKKIYTILGAMALTVAMNAQQLTHIEKPLTQKLSIQKATLKESKKSITSFANNMLPFKAPSAKEADTTLFAIYGVEGQMYMGSAMLSGYLPIPYYVAQPFQDTILFQSIYGAGTWKHDVLNDDETYTTITVEDTSVLEYSIPSYGFDYHNPMLSIAPSQKPSKDGSIIYNVTFRDYMPGYACEFYAPGEGYTPTNLMAGYWYPEYLTNCEMISANPDNQKSAQDVWALYWDETHFLYGTGLIDESYFGKGTVDTMGTILAIPEGKCMWVDTIMIECYSDEAASIEQAFPKDAKVQLTIYPIEIGVDPKTGETVQYLRHDSIIAQAVAGFEDLSGDNPKDFFIQFVLKEEDAFGYINPKPATLTQRCYAEFTGYNESKCNFIVLCDHQDHFTSGLSYIKKNDKYYTFGPNSTFFFHAYYPDMHLFSDTWIEEVPQEGGPISMGWINSETGQMETEEQIEFSCNIPEGFDDDVDLLDENGESIDPETDPIVHYYELYGPEEYLAGIAYVEVNPNEGYDLETTIYVKAMGAVLPIHFTQPGTLGPVPVGLHNVKAVNDNKTYNIFGMEVDKAYKGVVIRNGQTLLQ